MSPYSACFIGEPRKFDPNFKGPIHNRYYIYSTLFAIVVASNNVAVYGETKMY